DAPWRTSSVRTRSRTRPCSPAIPWSVEAVTSRAYTPLESFGCPGANGQRRRCRSDDLVFLLQAERHPIIARQPERVIAAVAPLDAALARFVRVAVFGILRDGA